MNVHVIIGIHTCNPSDCVAADLYLRLQRPL